LCVARVVITSLELLVCLVQITVTRNSAKRTQLSVSGTCCVFFILYNALVFADNVPWQVFPVLNFCWEALIAIAVSLNMNKIVQVGNISMQKRPGSYCENAGVMITTIISGQLVFNILVLVTENYKYHTGSIFVAIVAMVFSCQRSNQNLFEIRSIMSNLHKQLFTKKPVNPSMIKLAADNRTLDQLDSTIKGIPPNKRPTTRSPINPSMIKLAADNRTLDQLDSTIKGIPPNKRPTTRSPMRSDRKRTIKSPPFSTNLPGTLSKTQSPKSRCKRSITLPPDRKVSVTRPTTLAATPTLPSPPTSIHKRPTTLVALPSKQILSMVNLSTTNLSQWSRSRSSMRSIKNSSQPITIYEKEKGRIGMYMYSQSNCNLSSETQKADRIRRRILNLIIVSSVAIVVSVGFAVYTAFDILKEDTSTFFEGTELCKEHSLFVMNILLGLSLFQSWTTLSGHQRQKSQIKDAKKKNNGIDE